MDNSSKMLSNDMNDMISNLPDRILSHILSFIPTKQAVVTSVLSRRWKFLWTYIDILDFYQPTTHPSAKDPSKMQFAQFVHGVLQLHESPLIRRMHIRCYGKAYNDDDVAKWIGIAISKGVESLILGFCINVKFPPSLFCSQTLVELKLHYADIIDVNNSTAPLLPNLKILHLLCPKCNPDSLERFISGCSILEHLHLHFTSDTPDGACWISSATLKTFLSRQSQLNHFKNQMFILNTPALEFLELYNTRIFAESRLPSLHKAHISPGRDDLSYLKCFSNVAILCLKGIHRVLQPHNLDFPAGYFHNLTELEITAPKFCLAILRSFMKRSNNLQVITLIKDGIGGAFWEEPQYVPECLLSSLQTMCIQRYENEEAVASMIKYVLGNAKNMKSMNISSSDSAKNNHELNFRMLQMISKFPRACCECEIAFS